MEYLFYAFLLALGFYILAPFLSKRRTVLITSTKQQKLSSLQYRKQLLQNSLSELDFDFRMGKLAEQDREQAMQSLQAELKEIEMQFANQARISPDKMKEKLEKEIAARKKQINSTQK